MPGLCRAHALPALPIQRWSIAGNDCMDMRMMTQPLIPCMQNHQGSGLDTAFTGYRFINGLPGSAKQQSIEFAAIAQHQAGQSIREREYTLEVSHRWMQKFFRLFDPVRPPSASTLRTVSITAAVVNVMPMLTSVTLVDSSQHVWRSTEVDLQQCVLDLNTGAITVASEELVAELPEYFRDSQFRWLSCSFLACSFLARVGSIHCGH